jgi:FkbM family methyltransferase
VGDAGHVYAFEPERELHASLCANLQRNDISNVTAFNFAVGARESSGVLRISPIHSGGHALDDDRAPGFGTQPTEIRRLDDQLPDVKIAFVKIDVQGAEPEVLVGMRRILKRNPEIRVFLEFWPWGMRQRGHSPLGFFETFQDLGLRAHSAVPPYRLIADVPAFVQRLRGRRWENLLLSRSFPLPD